MWGGGGVCVCVRGGMVGRCVCVCRGGEVEQGVCEGRDGGEVCVCGGGGICVCVRGGMVGNR